MVLALRDVLALALTLTSPWLAESGNPVVRAGNDNPKQPNNDTESVLLALRRCCANLKAKKREMKLYFLGTILSQQSNSFTTLMIMTHNSQHFTIFFMA